LKELEVTSLVNFEGSISMMYQMVPLATDRAWSAVRRLRPYKLVTIQLHFERKLFELELFHSSVLDELNKKQKSFRFNCKQSKHPASLLTSDVVMIS